MKLFLNAAIVVSFFGVVAAIIWLVWDQEEFCNSEKAVISALSVFVALMLLALGLCLYKYRSCDDD